MKRVRTLEARETFVVEGDAPPWAHDLARQIERALAGYLRDPNFGPFTYKSDVINRMTETQVNDFDTLLSQSTARMRLLWDAITAVYHRSDFFAEFYGMFVDEFGMAEANRILAVSNA